MPNLILLGPRGSGKTTVGRRVSDARLEPFVDLDDLVQRVAGQSIREIFDAEGEAGFRQRESSALHDVLGMTRGIIATGGGIVVREENRKVLKSLDCPRVLLLAEPEVLFARITADATTAATRPALTAHAGIDEVRYLLDQRLAWYREVATHELDVGVDGTDELTHQVFELVGSASSGPPG